MKIKKVLFIDDGDISNIVEKMSLLLSGKGYDLYWQKVDLGNAGYKTENAGGEVLLDFSKIQHELESNHFNVYYDLVACDFNYANDPLNGFQVIKWLKNSANNQKSRIRRAKFISYSAEEDKFKKTIFENKEFSSFIRLKIDDFFKRDSLAEDVGRLLLKVDNTLNLSDYMRDELEKYPGFEFQSIYPKFSGKKFGEIAKQIDEGQHHGKEFQKYFVELIVAHMIELNNFNL